MHNKRYKQETQETQAGLARALLSPQPPLPPPDSEGCKGARAAWACRRLFGSGGIDGAFASDDAHEEGDDGQRRIEALERTRGWWARDGGRVDRRAARRVAVCVAHRGDRCRVARAKPAPPSPRHTSRVSAGGWTGERGSATWKRERSARAHSRKRRGRGRALLVVDLAPGFSAGSVSRRSPAATHRRVSRRDRSRRHSSPVRPTRHVHLSFRKLAHTHTKGRARV